MVYIDFRRFRRSFITNSLSINPDTLWSKLNECDKCVFFRNMVSKSLYATDYNNANTDVKTIFVPRDSRNNFFNIQMK